MVFSAKSGSTKSGSMLTCSQERLLMRFFDNECSLFSKLRAGRLISKNSNAQEFLAALKQTKLEMKKNNEAQDHRCDLWSRIAARIEAEERSAVFLGARTRDSWFQIPALSEWGARLTWGTSGAVAASALSFMLLRVASSGGAITSSPSFGSSNTMIPTVQSVSLGGTSNFDAGSPPALYGSPMEVDWVRSEGRVKLLQEPGDNTAIFWVKPRGPHTESYASSSRLSRRPSRVSPPVALQASNH